MQSYTRIIEPFFSVTDEIGGIWLGCENNAVVRDFWNIQDMWLFHNKKLNGSDFI